VEGEDEEAKKQALHAQLAAAHSVVILLFAAMDHASPRGVTGEIIEELARFGNKRKGFSERTVKEVEKGFQAYLKKQQASQEVWKKVRKKLNEKQLDLLDAYKGHLSYFS